MLYRRLPRGGRASYPESSGRRCVQLALLSVTLAAALFGVSPDVGGPIPAGVNLRRLTWLGTPPGHGLRRADRGRINLDRDDRRRRFMRGGGCMPSTGLVKGVRAMWAHDADSPHPQQYEEEFDVETYDIAELNYTAQDLFVRGPGEEGNVVQASGWIDTSNFKRAKTEASAFSTDSTIHSTKGGGCRSSSGKRAVHQRENNKSDLCKKYPVCVFEESGDGACLFRSLARQVKDDEEKHNEVRQELVDFLEAVFNISGPTRLPDDPARPPVYPLPPREITKAQRKLLVKHARCFVDPEHPKKVRAYLRQMRDKETWGTSLEALAAAYVYKRPVWVWMQDISGEPDPLNPEDRTCRPIGLLHVRGNHWNSAFFADDEGHVAGRNITSWISASMCVLRTDNSTGGARKYLFLRTDNAGLYKWTMPWGHVTDGETIQEVAMRRLKEEVGLDINKGDVQVQNRSFMSRDITGIRCNSHSVLYVCSIFLSEVCEGVSTDLNPAYNASWFTYEEILNLEKQSEIQPLLSKAVETAEHFNFTPVYYDTSELDSDTLEESEEGRHELQHTYNATTESQQ